MTVKKIKIKALLIISILCMFFILGLSGCGGGGSRGPSPFQAAFLALAMNDQAVADLGTSLSDRLPELTIDGRAPLFTTMPMGDDQSAGGAMRMDPMMGMGMTVRFSALIASSEIDVVIANMDNAARFSRSDFFAPLSDILSENEIAQLGDRLLSFELVDIDGTAAVGTGEFTAVVGFDISDNDQIREIFGNQEVGIFVIGNSGKLDLSRAMLRFFF